MNILITGAAGGIGSMLSYHLHSLGHTLYLLDNLKNGNKKNLVFSDVDLSSKLIVGDIREIETYFKQIEIDAVIHLAAISSLPDCQSNPSDAMSVNVQGTMSVLEFSRKKEIPYVFFASTSAVYENNKEERFSEEDPICPNLIYPMTKKFGEDICKSYSENYGMTITIARFFNVFGPKQDIYRKSPPLLNYLVKQFVDGQVPQLHSNGQQRRDYVHISDIIAFLDKCLKIKPNCTLNVCSGRTISVNEIVDCVKEALNCSIKPNFRDSTMLWDSYKELFNGKFAIRKEIVSRETNKYANGNTEKSEKILSWKANADIETLIKQTALEIKNSL